MSRLSCYSYKDKKIYNTESIACRFPALIEHLCNKCNSFHARVEKYRGDSYCPGDFSEIAVSWREQVEANNFALYLKEVEKNHTATKKNCIDVIIILTALFLVFIFYGIIEKFTRIYY